MSLDDKIRKVEEFVREYENAHNEFHRRYVGLKVFDYVNSLKDYKYKQALLKHYYRRISLTGDEQ